MSSISCGAGHGAIPPSCPGPSLSLWVVAVLGLTALSGFRLPHYGLPAYPAIALLAVRGWYVARPRALALALAAMFAAGAVGCRSGLER